MEEKNRMKELEQGIAEIAATLQAPGAKISAEASLLVRTGQMYAEAESILYRKREQVLSELLYDNPGMSANEQKIRVEAKCSYEASVTRRIEQVNKALSLIVATNKRS